jgi:integrase
MEGVDKMDYIQNYLNYLVKRNRKSNSLKNYWYKINRCLETLKDNGMETDPLMIGETELWFLIMELNIKEQTVRSYVELFNRFLKFYTKKDLLEEMNPLWNRAKVQRVHISEEDFVKLYNEANPQERMILILGVGLGLRRMEIRKLEIRDIIANYITIHGKGHGREGLVVRMKMPTLVRDELRNYMVWRSEHAGNDRSDGKLIVYKDEEGIHCYCSDDSIWYRVKAVAKRAGVGKATVHALRRFFATELKKNKCDIVVIKDLMRHESINTTLLYFEENEIQQEAELESMTARISNITAGVAIETF